MLHVENIRYRYGEGPLALCDVSFSLPRGQVVGLLGPNGAGKTTLLYCMLGLRRPEGTVTLDGVQGERIRGQIGFITGRGAAIGNLSPLETGAFLQHFYPGFDMPRLKRLLSYFQLRNSAIRHMSTGERMKAELALGLCRGVEYLLMDEPFHGEDVFTRKEFIRILAGSLREQETLLISTHLIDDIAGFIERVLVLHKGRLVADEQVDALLSRGETLESLLMEKTEYDPNRAAALFSEE